MGLRENKTIVAIPLLGGLDTKTSAQVVVPGDLVVCENGEFTKGGSLRKRAGHTATLPQLTDGTPITDALGLASLGDGWVLLGRQNAYLHDPVRNAWSTLGPYTPITHRETEVARVSAQQSNPDLDSVNGVTCVAWEDTRGGVRFSVFEDASGAALVSDVSLIAANATKPKVTAVGPNLWVTWHNSSTTAIEARIVLSANVKVAATTANVTLAANANASVQYDIVGGDGVAYLAYRQDAAVADTVQLVIFSPAGTPSATTTGINAVVAIGPSLCWSAVTNAVFVCGFTTAGNALTSRQHDGTNLTLLDAVTGSLANTLALGIAPRANGGASVWVQYGTTAAARQVQVYAHNVGAGTLAAGALTMRSVLATQPWFDGYNTLGVLAYAGTANTGLQGGYFLVRDDGVFVGRAIYGSGHDLSTNVPHVKSVGADRYTCALGFRRQVPVNLAKVLGAPPGAKSLKFSPVYQHRGIQRADFDHNPKLTPVEIDGVLYTNGGWLWAIDGAGPPVEAQLQQFPDVAAADIVASAGAGLTANGVYGYRWYYEWTDVRGHRVRSMALSLTYTAPAATNLRTTHTLPTLPFTATTGRAGVALVGYRTAANDPTFYYRVTSADPSVAGNNGYVINNTAATTVMFIDQLDDTALISREVDYMSQGEVEHIAFDAPAAIGEAGNRLWAVGGGERPDRPQYSLVRTDGEPVEANDSFVVTEFPEDGGSTVAVSQLNGVPVVFKERAIYAIEGIGLLNNRDNSQPYAVRQLSSDVGCTEPRSVLSTAEGIYFKSAKGIYLLGQDLVPAYIGAFVEAYNAQTVTGAGIVPDTNQCVFLTDDGLALMYDYFYKRWSTYTNHTGVSLAAGRSGFAYLRLDGSLFVRAPETFTDAGVPYTLRWRTGPIRLEDTIQGQAIIRKVMCIGEYRSSHELEVRVFRNRELWPNQIFRWLPDARMGLTIWGDDAVWGDPTSIWGGTTRASEYEFDNKIKARKVSTIAFEITDVPGNPPGASYEMTELALEVFTQPGLARLPASRKI